MTVILGLIAHIRLRRMPITLSSSSYLPERSHLVPVLEWLN